MVKLVYRGSNETTAARMPRGSRVPVKVFLVTLVVKLFLATLVVCGGIFVQTAVVEAQQGGGYEPIVSQSERDRPAQEPVAGEITGGEDGSNTGGAAGDSSSGTSGEGGDEAEGSTLPPANVSPPLGEESTSRPATTQAQYPGGEPSPTPGSTPQTGGHSMLAGALILLAGAGVLTGVAYLLGIRPKTGD